MLRTVIAEEANHSEALFYLGKMYYSEKKYQLAVDFLKKILLIRRLILKQVFL